MRPVAILQHDHHQGPGYLKQYLDEIGVETRLFAPDEGDDVPRQARDFSGIVLLGSPRGVDDPLPRIGDEIALARDAMTADVPLLGHCFGAQLMARALGATVCRNSCPNIGWGQTRVTARAQRLFGADAVTSFNWHYDTFAIPEGAQRLLYDRHCLNKAFGIGKHLAFQCHFEVTEPIVRGWCKRADDELAEACGPAVQTRAQILRDMKQHLPALHATARRVYLQWASQLVRPPLIHLSGGW